MEKLTTLRSYLRNAFTIFSFHYGGTGKNRKAKTILKGINKQAKIIFRVRTAANFTNEMIVANAEAADHTKNMRRELPEQRHIV